MMKTKYYIALLLSLLLGTGILSAQNTNQLIIPDLTALPGSTASIPIYLENVDDIVAVQFLLKVPSGSTLDPSTATLTNRAANHSVTLRPAGGQEYLCVIFSPSNAALKGRSGKLMTVNMQVSGSYAEESIHQFELKEIILSRRDGSNVFDGVKIGSLTITKRPDLQPLGVRADKTSYDPGATLAATWTVKNVGGAATGAGWTERISLVQADGTSVLLGTERYDGKLLVGNTVLRKATLTLPDLPGIDGEAQLQVQVVPQSETGEGEAAQANNIALSETKVNVSKRLILTLPSGIVNETYSQPVKCMLSRSGRRSMEETFTITATDDSRLNVPASVTIPQGQSAVNFYLQLTKNGRIDDNAVINFAIAGNGYEAVTGMMEIDDDTYPNLTIKASKTDISEGDIFQLTITSSYAVAQPVVLTLTSENTSRFSYPSQITLPAKATTVTVDVTAVEDDTPAMPLSNIFAVSAKRYNRGTTTVVLADDDLPALTLTLVPDIVSEDDGVMAVTAVLRRTGKTDNSITVKLSDNAQGKLFYSRSSIVLDKGVSEAQVNLGPVDNNTVDGDRTYTLTAAVYLPGCGCYATAQSAGYATAQLKVLEDDGPALKLTSSVGTVGEGGKFRLTVTRNTATTGALAVTVGSEQDDVFETYNHTLTIPAGQTSTSIELTSKKNNTSGDTRTVVFTAEATSFATGTCWVMVTDQTLPDARVSLTADQERVIVGGDIVLTAQVSNQGATALPSGMEVSFYEGNTLLKTLTTKTSIAVGSTEVLTFTVSLPESIVTKHYYAKVNEGGTVHEVSYSNNASAGVTIITMSPYSTTVTLNKNLYGKGETVQIGGQLTGSRTANQKVEVYVVNEGMRQTVETQSDSQGRFTAEYTPYSSQSGHFAVGACYPGEAQTQEMASFDIYGLRRASGGYITHQLMVGDSYTDEVKLYNPGNLNLTSAKVRTVSAPKGCTVSYRLADAINGGSYATLRYAIKGEQASAGDDWETIVVRVLTAEGATLDFNILVHFRNPNPNLVASPARIVTTMVKDASRDYELTITNTGRGVSGAITLDLPPWMACATGKSIASLDANEQTTVILRFTPTSNMQLNMPVTGTIGVNSESGFGTAVSYSITPVSEATGTLVVDVTDELTYYTDEQPHVKGAFVEVLNPATGEVVTNGTTGDDGIFRVTLSEGYYRLNVTADRHDSYSNVIVVDPGMETCREINLSYNVVSVSWTVVETEIEDEYEIKTNVKFETMVPVPVVELTIPGKINTEQMGIGQSQVFHAILTNKGLIKALDTDLLLPTDITHLSFEPLCEYTGLTIKPQESIIIPVKVTRLAATPTTASCYAQFGVSYSWNSGKTIKSNRYFVTMLIGTCHSSDVVTWGETATGGGWVAGPGKPSGSGGSSYSSSTIYHRVTEVTENARAVVSLQFDQKLKMTRQAFRGTLTVANGCQTDAMSNIRLQLTITDPDGVVATEHEFGIRAESLDGFQGEVSTGAAWTLGAGATGTASILFTPSKYAAPTTPVDYAFGGTLSYVDPFSGLEVITELKPVTLTVNPTADIDLTYFLQRDIYGNDPLTAVVEDSQPAEFSVIINNVGYGDAKNLSIVTAAPRIVEDEWYRTQGLLVDFTLLGAQLNGKDWVLPLGGNVTTDFGTLPAHTTVYAQWWFQSSLLGHFIDYNIQATHVTGYGNPALSLLNNVTIHELIRSIKTDNGQLTGFVVNDLPDADDMPDMVYFTDGTTDEVYVTDNVSMQRQSATQYLLTVTPTAAGWNYGRITDPVGGTGQLVSVVRQSDGCEINLRNFWQTDRTLIDGTEWLYEDNIHFVDNMTLGTESYLLTFTLKPELVLEVASITDVSSDGNIQNAPLKTVTVTFNKPIDADTFTADDITLNCQGSRVNEEITITQVSNMQFTLDLSKATTTDGYYVLTIQTAGITDATGFIGEKGKSVSWIQNLPTFVRETLIMPSVQPCYLLSGQRINRPVRRGVYIRNGRKVIVR